MTKRKYAVIGSGALGGLYGGLLAKAGFEVHFLLHSDYEHVRDQGLRVESVWGDFYLRQVHAHCSPRTMPACDVTLIGLKTTHNHLLKQLLRSPTSGGGVALTLQNGLGIEADVAAALHGHAKADAADDQVHDYQGPDHRGPDYRGLEDVAVDRVGAAFPPEIAARVLTGCCFVCSNKVGPGHIKHLDQGKIVFGDWQQRDDHSRPISVSSLAREIESDFHAAGIQSSVTNDMLTTRWRKLLWNIPFNGLSVVLDASSQELIEHPGTLRLARQLMVEVQRGAETSGVMIPDAMIEKTIQVTQEMVPYDSSMRLDYLNRRPLEIDALFRAPLARVARELASKSHPSSQSDRPSGDLIMPTVAAIESQLSFLQTMSAKRS